MTTKGEVKKRRTQILDMIVKGMSQTEIADQLNTSVKNVNRDAIKVREEVVTQLSNTSQWQRIAEYTQKADARIKRLWHIILENKSTQRDLMRAIALLRQEDELAIKRDQSIGLLPRDPTPLIQITEQKQTSNVQIVIVKPEDIKEMP